MVGDHDAPLDFHEVHQLDPEFFEASQNRSANARMSACPR